ncbi:MAG: Kae1-associated serine/threonine protein kinase [Desulfurococcales archaeon]|nr:Kae1-associated serine/threonine protein kinase [Desulfurococcales archaeon]
MDALDLLYSALSRGKIIYIGAESIVYLSKLFNRNVIVKRRIRKTYVHPSLMDELIYQRTRKESRALVKSLENNICVPKPLFVLLSKGVIIMEYLRGRRLYEVLEELETNSNPGFSFAENLFCSIGSLLGGLHSLGIVHGDFSAGNIILGDKGPCIIDFGLSDFREDAESRALDLHVLNRSLNALYPSITKMFWDKLVQCYLEKIRDYRVLGKLEDMMLRGRYVEERRYKNGFYNKQ